MQSRPLTSLQFSPKKASQDTTAGPTSQQHSSGNDNSRSKALIRRLCASCSSIIILQIHTGKTFYFEEPLVQGGCNLCDFFRALYANHIERDFRYTANPPNTELRKTTPMHTIKIEILSLKNVEEHTGLCSPVTVVETSIIDTWYGNKFNEKLYFRDLQSVDECTPERHAVLKPRSGGIELKHAMLSMWADLTLARSWVQECIAHHPACGPVVPAGIPSVLHPSTKFIDLHLNCLVELESIVGVPIEYVALSYVWGRDYHLLTTSITLEVFKRRLPIADFDAPNKLPKTIQDAILVTRALGYRFLWSDALCIVQDSPADIGIQLAQMDRIYGLAVTTITARGSLSSDGGIPGISLPRNQIKDVNPEVAINNGLSIGHWKELSDIEEEYEEGHGDFADKKSYIWRGWTFQEQILSTRSLELNPKRMMFWCGQKMSNPETGYPAAATSDMRNPHHFRHTVRQFRRTQLNPSAHPPDEVMSADMLVSRWHTMRENYSKRSFTYPTDRRNGILGTATMLRNILGGIDSGGHHRNGLHEELLWYWDAEPGGSQPTKVKFLRDPAPDGLFPSWSWLSLWPLRWPALGKPFPGVSVHISGNSDFEHNSSLVIEGPLLQLRLIDDPDGKKEQKFCYKDGTLANIKLRLDSPLPTGVDVVCVPLAKTIFDMWWEQGMLLLRFVGPHYVRIGVGSISEYKDEELMKRINSGEAERNVIICQ